MGFQKGHTMTTKGKGKAHAWLVEHIGYQGDDCLTWPFFRDKKPPPLGGRGMLQHNGQRGWAHRFMCELVYGPPPTPKHKAAHECGNGHLGCVNPKHLKWKTQAQNLADMKRHGTNRGNPDGHKMNWEKAQYVRDMRGVKTQQALAGELGVSEGTINDIWRDRKWRPDRKMNYWTPEQDARLKALLQANYTYAGAGKIMGKSRGAVDGRVARLGLRQAAAMEGERG